MIILDVRIVLPEAYDLDIHTLCQNIQDAVWRATAIEQETIEVYPKTIQFGVIKPKKGTTQ